MDIADQIDHETHEDQAAEMIDRAGDERHRNRPR